MPSIKDVYAKKKLDKYFAERAKDTTTPEEDTFSKRKTPKGPSMGEAYQQEIRDELDEVIHEPERGYPITKAKSAIRDTEADAMSSYYTGMRQAQGEIDETEKEIQRTNKAALEFIKRQR